MLKLFGVGGLILLMLIPLLMIQGVLSDRLARRNEAVNDITSSWGGKISRSSDRFWWCHICITAPSFVR